MLLVTCVLIQRLVGDAAPLILLATVATVIASQSIISGAYFDDATRNQPRLFAAHEHHPLRRP
jgi:K+ potassium transporter